MAESPEGTESVPARVVGGSGNRNYRAKPGWRKAFLAELGRSGAVYRSAKAAGVTTGYAYRVRKANPRFRKQWAKALARSAEVLEQEARRRAVKGVRVPVYQSGQFVGWKREYSDSLLQFLLKGNNPKKFGDKSKVEHSGPGGKPLFAAESQEAMLADPALLMLACELDARMASGNVATAALPAPDGGNVATEGETTA